MIPKLSNLATLLQMQIKGHLDQVKVVLDISAGCLGVNVKQGCCHFYKSQVIKL